LKPPAFLKLTPWIRVSSCRFSTVFCFRAAVFHLLAGTGNPFAGDIRGAFLSFSRLSRRKYSANPVGCGIVLTV
jgi:hypothetical protein